MSEKQKIREIVRPVIKLIEDDEYNIFLSELENKAKVDTVADNPRILLEDDFGGLY